METLSITRCLFADDAASGSHVMEGKGYQTRYNSSPFFLLVVFLTNLVTRGGQEFTACEANN